MTSEDIATLLGAGGLGLTAGTNLFVGGLEPTPDRQVSIIETPGASPIHTMGQGPGNVRVVRPRVQIIARAETSNGARQLAHNIFQALDGLNDQVVNGTKYHLILGVSLPASMGSNTSGLTQVVANYDITKAQSTSTST